MRNNVNRLETMKRQASDIIMTSNPVCWGVPGIPLLEVHWLLVFLVSGCLVQWLLVPWFLGFLVSKIMSFLFSKFLGSLVSKILGFLVWNYQGCKDWMIPYYQMPMSFFVIDVDFTSKNFKIWLDGFSGFVGVRLFQHFPKHEIRHFEIYKAYY